MSKSARTVLEPPKFTDSALNVGGPGSTNERSSGVTHPHQTNVETVTLWSPFRLRGALPPRYRVVFGLDKDEI